LDRIAAEQECEIPGCAEAPFAGDLDQVDATLRISALELAKEACNIGALRHPAGEVVSRQRLGACEKKQLDHAAGLAALLRRLRGVLAPGPPLVFRCHSARPVPLQP